MHVHTEACAEVLARATFLNITFGYDPNNRCLWITMLIQERLLGFCSLYAPNLKSATLNLCNWMTSSLLDVEWIVGGNLTMVEWEGDRDGGVGAAVSGFEKHYWARCKAAPQLVNFISSCESHSPGGWLRP
jgi:hypothetical protein